MRTSILVCMILLLSTSGHAECPTADLSGDCFVGLADLAVMAGQWEGEPNMPLLYDMASQWLTEGVPVDPENLVWVSINDSGAGMKDGRGNPISHGGFTGEMSKYETTNAQYCEFLNAAIDSNDITVGFDDLVYGANGSNSGADFVGENYFRTYSAISTSQITYDGNTFSVRSRNGYDMSNHPVADVSWYGATAFANYYGWRLPTEWEWQAVADYDGSYTYGCGTSINQSKANYYDNGYANPLGLFSAPYTSPVNHYSSYGYGMNDMAGNLREWTSTVEGDSTFRVTRGGSWVYGVSCTVSFRSMSFAHGSFNDIGFRVCR